MLILYANPTTLKSLGGETALLAERGGGQRATKSGGRLQWRTWVGAPAGAGFRSPGQTSLRWPSTSERRHLAFWRRVA